MLYERISSYWIPLLLAAVFLILSLGLPELGVELPSWTAMAGIVVSLMLIVGAGALAFRPQSSGVERGFGGRGGDASVVGNKSTAEGGAGGESRTGVGGDGGSAKVKGNRSTAIGGRGGAAKEQSMR